MRKFAISDIHGCRQTFDALLKGINLKKKDELYLLGDYIDRGPDSKGVLDRIFQLKEEGFKVFCTVGNHEAMMIQSIGDGEVQRTWLAHGGLATLQSFGVKTVTAVPDRYLDFIEELDYFIESDNFLLVHAGLNFHAPDPLEDFHSMMWIRNWHRDVNKWWLGKRKIIHGHTPTPVDRIKEQKNQLKNEGYLCIDAGAGMAALGREGMLCAFEMTQRKLYFQPFIDG